MEPFFVVYLATWVGACLVATGLSVQRRRTLEWLQGGYWRMLLQPWKVATFVVATTGLAVIAPYTGDPTWDYVDATFMGVFTYLSAPWAVGTLYLWLRRRRGWREAWIAACLWLFSASWSYDLYLLLRDGSYPVMWSVNLVASSVLYVAAGLFWSLEHVAGRGVVLGFMQADWPATGSAVPFARVAWYALPFMLLVGAIIGSFLW